MLFPAGLQFTKLRAEDLHDVSVFQVVPRLLDGAIVLLDKQCKGPGCPWGLWGCLRGGAARDADLRPFPSPSPNLAVHDQLKFAVTVTTHFAVRVETLGVAADAVK